MTPHISTDEDAVDVEEEEGHKLEENKYTEQYHEEAENYMDEVGESIIDPREYRKRKDISDEYCHDE